MGRTRGLRESERGASPLLGLVLLFALVVLGGALLFAVGTPALDAVESETQGELVHMCMDESDHRLSTVVRTGHEQPMEFDVQSCQPDVAETGQISITWYNSSEADQLNGTDPSSPWNDANAVSEPIGTLEFELSDRTLAHQGGGIWELTDSSVRIEKPPKIGFGDDDDLELNLMRIETANVDGSSSKAVNDHEAAKRAVENLTAVAENPDGDHLAMKIESEYAEGWERHLEREVDNVTAWNVSVDRPEDDVVILTVEEMGNVSAPSYVGIDADHGLTTQGNGGGKTINENVVELNEEFHINATVTNYGDEKTAVTATLSIWNESGVVEERTIESKSPKAELDPGESIRTDEQNHWRWPGGAGNHKFDPSSIGLASGHKYEYGIETEPGGDTFDDPGSFYYLHDTAHYTIVDAWTDTSGDRLTISADVRNLGSDNGSTEPITLEISPVGGNDSVTSTAQVRLNSTEAGTVSWTIDETDWPNGDYEFAVTTPDDDADGTFEVTAGGAFVISEDLGLPEDTQLNGTDGQVITADDPVTVRANVTNTYATDRTQNVTLEVLDSDGTVVGSARTNLSIEAGETEQVELTTEPLEAGEVYEYNISTESDDLDDLGSFLVVDEPAQFHVDSLTVDGPVTPGDSLAVEAEIRNEGESGDQFVWIEGFNGDVVDVREINLDAGASTTVALEWGSVAVPDSVDDTNLTVQTTHDEETAAVEVEPLLLIDDVRVVDDPIEPGATATVEVGVKSVAGTAAQDVVLEGFDGSPVDSRTVSVADGETQTVELRYRTDGDAITDRIAVRTDDDEQEEVVVVERDGPDCSAVSYEGSGTGDDPYQVSTIDELQCINDHDLGAHYELVDDIDAHGTEYWNGGAGFEPIGPKGHNYPNTYWQRPSEIDHEPFRGTFDGNGHVIDGLTINRPTENFVGLFGATSYTQDFHPETGRYVEPGEGSLIENVRLTNVHVVGEQHVGGLAGQAGGTVRNARSEGYVEGQEQLVGGLIGDGAHADINNRLVAAGTVVGGEIDPEGDANSVNHEGIGGLIGRASWNTQVSTAYTQTDVTGDEYVGAVVGTSSYRDSTFEQLYTSGSASAESADAGAIVGTVLSEGDEFKDSVYWDESIDPEAYGEAGNHRQDVDMDNVRTDWNGRQTDEMTGLGVTESGRMGNLDFEDEGGPWVAIPDDYPRFAWELAAEGLFEVEISSVENVTAGESATVEVTVTSRFEKRDESNVTQTIALEDPDGNTVDTETVTLPSTLGTDEQATIELVWPTDPDDGSGEVVVRSEDREDAAPIEIEEADHGPGSSDGPLLGPAPGDGSVGSGDDADLGPGNSDASADDVPEIGTDITIDVDVVAID